MYGGFVFVFVSGLLVLVLFLLVIVGVAFWVVWFCVCEVVECGGDDAYGFVVAASC